MLFLVILNLLYGLWQYYFPVSQITELEPLPQDLGTLHMLAEIVNEDLAAIENPIDEQPQENNGDKKLFCYTLGPFKDEALANTVSELLRRHVKKLKRRSREESEQHRYWVYIPSLDSRTAAIAMSKRLAKEKIKDYYIIRSGSKNNGISLGHFKEKHHAYRRLERLTALGFAVDIEPVSQVYQVYWLDYQVLGESPAELEAIKSFQEDGVARLDRACES